MEDAILSRAMQVRASSAAAVFTDSRRRRLLLGFVGREQSLAEVCSASGLAMGYVHYHAGRWVQLGLLEVSGERRRAGRPVKLYRAAGDAFFVAEAYLPRSANAGLADELARGLDQARANDGDSGLLFLVENGRPRIRRIDGPARGPATEMWRFLDLDETAAAALEAELETLARRYGDRPGARTRPYLFHVALAPRPRI